MWCMILKILSEKFTKKHNLNHLERDLDLSLLMSHGDTVTVSLD